jgi:GH43 family beta-xylosidase
MTTARATFRNPLAADGADPWLTFHDGWYYLSTTRGWDIRLRRARRLGDLRDAPDEVVWRDDAPGRFRDMWAQEFHRLDGPDGPRWYLYYTASDGEDARHRMYVCEGAEGDPRGPYTFKSQLQTDARDEWYAIDGTVLARPDGSLYFLWCGRPSPAGQGLYISRMADPWTLAGERVYLPADGFGCAEVREGPVTLERGGRVFLVYSACDTGKPDYKLAMLVAEPGADLLDPEAWTQHPAPVFTRNDGAGVYGPGHCFFFRSPDGTEDWIAYHAKTSPEYTYAGRSARAQPFTWTPDGRPDFGAPLPLDAAIPAPSGEPA